RGGCQAEFDADPSVAGLVADANDCRRKRSKLGPGEAGQPELRPLVGLDAPDRGRWEPGNDARLPRRDEDAEYLPGTNNRTHRQFHDLAHPPGDRRPEDAHFHFMLQAADRILFGRDLPVELDDLLLEFDQVGCRSTDLDLVFPIATDGLAREGLKLGL